MRENIDNIDKFLMIHQNFPYQIFLLAIANVTKATDLAIFYSSKFSRDMTVDMYHVQAKQFFAVRCKIQVISCE